MPGSLSRAARAVLPAVWLLLAGGGWAEARVACPLPLSGGSPPVRTQHIFCGEINRRGQAVGFHSRPGGRNPDTVEATLETRPDPRRPGIYTLTRFRITEGHRSAVKTLSTMFPDHCDADQVIAAIQHAYNTGQRTEESFRGSSGPTCTDARGQPFRIRGFTGNAGGRVTIITAYPD
ncbi:MAG: EndoU domain-containing protein [Acetobacteraceae bacterium]